MEDNMQEYVTFFVKAKDGSTLEMAVMDEFDFEKKHYIAAAEVQDDTVLEDGLYIYQAVMKEDGDFEALPIKKAFDYRRIAAAYAEISEEDSPEDSAESSEEE